jgi:ribosomal protein S14
MTHREARVHVYTMCRKGGRVRGFIRSLTP